MDDLVDLEPQEWGLYRVNNWKLQLCRLPRKCYLSGKSLWGKQCYKGSRQVREDINLVVHGNYYIEKLEFIIWNLKGKK